MKKVILLVLVSLMVSVFASTCFAFPSVGKYESESTVLYEDNTGKRYGSLWSFEVIDEIRRSHFIEIEENPDGSITLYGLSNARPLKNSKVTLYKTN